MSENQKNEMERGDLAYQRGDYATAIKYYTKQAQEGNPTAEGNLGYCFYYGLGVLPNVMRAREHWENGAALGDIRSLYKLGDLYRNGDLPKDLEKSHDFYVEAFQKSHESEDLNAYPNAYIRMLREYPEEACTKEHSALDIAKRCVDGLEKRIQEGDRYSHVELMEAKKYLKELEG